MKNIGEKVVEVIQNEEQKFNKEVKGIDTLIEYIDEIDKMYPRKKPSYSLPLVDTIGKTYYDTLNRSMVI